MDKRALFDLSYGVYVVSTRDGDRSTGCIANSVMQITSEPATIAVSMNHANYTHECIKKSGVFVVSVLTENSDPSIIGEFGFKSGMSVSKFANIKSKEYGGILIPDAAKSFILCRVINTLETATHTVFLGEVADAAIIAEGEPMTYAYYHKVIKGKSPKNAPTYVAEDLPEKSVWKCSVCGYVYDGDVPFEELPESYICPICGVPKSMFRKK